jgi:hypothetical protein
MRAALIFVLSASLSLVAAGCGVQSAVIRSQALSYDDVIEDTTDKLLLLNILRAKDKAPLHFDEIPSIHESIQATASVQASWPFGATDTGNKPTTRNTVTPGIMVQATPTFEVDHLDTKDFVTGIASPIDPKFVKYWLDRGLDRRLVLLLFFSAVTVTETDPTGGPNATTTIRLTNSPRDAIDTLPQQQAILKEGPISDELLRCDTHSNFQHYLKLIDYLTPFSPQYFREPRILAENLGSDASSDDSSAKPSGKPSAKSSANPGVNANDKPKQPNWQAIAALDTDKFRWKRNANGTFNVYALSSEPKATLCPITSADVAPRHGVDCIQLGVEKNPDELAAPQPYPLPSPPIGERPQKVSPYCELFNGLMSGNVTQDRSHPNAKIEIRFEIRSVGEMIQFLGDLLEYQEELGTFLRNNPLGQLRLHDPVTFGYCDDHVPVSQAAGCNDVFFNLPPDSCNSRFSVRYRGRTYAVHNYNPPEGENCQIQSPYLPGAPGRDHTLEVLSVVHQMVDLQKSAQDIRETPYVQVLP